MIFLYLINKPNIIFISRRINNYLNFQNKFFLFSEITHYLDFPFNFYFSVREKNVK